MTKSVDEVLLSSQKVKLLLQDWPIVQEDSSPRPLATIGLLRYVLFASLTLLYILIHTITVLLLRLCHLKSTLPYIVSYTRFFKP